MITSMTELDDRPADAESRWVIVGTIRAALQRSPRSLMNMSLSLVRSNSVEPVGAELRPIVVDPVIDYFFGTGTGPVTHWHSPPDVDIDGDGTFDAVALDFDGDGRVDDAMWDSDGDGSADTVALDLSDDASPDSFYTDSGRGLWEVPGRGPGVDDPPARRPPADSVAYDLDGNGRDDARATGVHRAGGALAAGRVYLDTDGDGTYDYVLIDRDGDGVADRGEPASG